MEKDKNEREKVLTRILTKSPCSVVLPQDIDTVGFTDSFIEAYEEPLRKDKILPVRIKCGSFPDAISIWKELALRTKEAISSVFDGDIITNRCFMAIEQVSTTDAIKSYLTRVFSRIDENSGWTILLVMEDFENAIEKMEEYDIMKVRGITTYAAIMSVTHTDLRKLCEDKYGHAYFCNQFVTFRF